MLTLRPPVVWLTKISDILFNGEMTAERGEHLTKSILHPLMIESPNPQDR